MLRILGAPRRVRFAVAGTFVLSAVLLSTGLASMAAAAQTSQVPQQVQYTAQPGYGQDDGDHGKPTKTPTKTATPSKSPSKSPTMSPTPSKSVSPTATATPTTASPTVAPTKLPVTGSSTGPAALVGGGLLLSGLTLLGVWRFVARRT